MSIANARWSDLYGRLNAERQRLTVLAELADQQRELVRRLTERERRAWRRRERLQREAAAAADPLATEDELSCASS